jgi:hypothetical protein
MEPGFPIREALLSIAHSVKAALEELFNSNLNATEGQNKNLHTEF